jgi:ABC-type spermidine/putrescine transport system permease subunit I
MKLRRNSGATLAFVAGSIIFIVIVALAFYFLSQLLGGGRELQAATNSGSLNVAKQSILTPKV